VLLWVATGSHHNQLDGFLPEASIGCFGLNALTEKPKALRRFTAGLAFLVAVLSVP
jgi:hypothetical protein